MPQIINLRKIAISLAMFAVVAFASASVARADVYTLTNSNFAGSGNFGTVTTTLVGNTIQVNVTLTQGYVFHSSGAFGFNVVDPDAGVSISAISPNTIFSYPGGTGVQYDGFGNFEFSIDSNQSASQARGTNTRVLTFTVSRTNGFTDANQLAELNGSGWFFAAQIAPLDTSAATGFAAGAGTATATPEPTSMLLLGTGLMGVAGLARRRFKK